MKKYILLLCVILMFNQNYTSADIINPNYNNGNVYKQDKRFIPVQAPDYARFYDIDSEKFTAKFIPYSNSAEKLLSGSIKTSYKNAKKIEKYIADKNYKKAVGVDGNFLPTHLKYYHYLVDKNDMHSAMNEMMIIKRINSADRVLNDDIVSYKLGMLYYLNKNYAGALSYLADFADKKNPSEENLWFALGDIYSNLNNYEMSLKYAKKIPSTSINYTPALEILYNDYYGLKDNKNAEIYARELVKRSPNATNYVRLATVSSSNDSEKLRLLYTAKDYAVTNYDYDSLLRADFGIAKLEQKKIDAAASKLYGFVVKPDWNKIYEVLSPILEPLELSKMQSEFFGATNNCITRYNGNDLIKCFENVNSEENSKVNGILQEYEQAYIEQLQAEAEAQRQQEFLMRTYYQRMYIDDFMYMRHYPRYFMNNFW